MSRHVLNLEKAGLEVHAGFNVKKGSLFAQVYRQGETTPIDYGHFGWLGIEALAKFLQRNQIEPCPFFLEALLKDATKLVEHRVVIWNEDGVVESDSMNATNDQLH